MSDPTAADKFKQRSKNSRGASGVLTNWPEPQRTLPKADAPALQTASYPPRKARPRRVNTYLTAKEGELLTALVEQARRDEQDNKIGEGIILGRALLALKTLRDRQSH